MEFFLEYLKQILEKAIKRNSFSKLIINDLWNEKKMLAIIGKIEQLYKIRHMWVSFQKIINNKKSNMEIKVKK